MQLLIIKHGKTDYNIQGKRLGGTDLLLNDIGKKEVLEVKKQLPNLTYDAIFSSPLKRALETASILFPRKKVSKEKLLTEYDFGELEGVLFSEPLTKFPNNKVEEYNGMKFLIPTRGESFLDILERCRKFLNFLSVKYNKQAVIAVITHSTNMEIIKAICDNKPWYSYLGSAKQFHGFTLCDFSQQI